jgi:prephenate dehydrogenase
MIQVGIIGFGVFGRFMAGQLVPHTRVVVSSGRASAVEVAAAGAELVSFEEAAGCEVIIPCVPVQNMEEVLGRLAKVVRPGALVVDVASVKVAPVEMMKRLLPESCELLATHPLFGPQSGGAGISGLKMVTLPVRISNERYVEARRFLGEQLGLKLIEMSPEEHDREMAYVQALTFYLGRALNKLPAPDSPLATKTYGHLLEIRDIVAGDSPQLFESIQRFNPYAAETRARLRETLEKVEGELNE